MGKSNQIWLKSNITLKIIFVFFRKENCIGDSFFFKRTVDCIVTIDRRIRLIMNDIKLTAKILQPRFAISGI